MCIRDSNDTAFEIVDIDDGQYEFQINAIMSDNYEIRGDILRLDVFFVLPAPSLSSSDYAINLGDEVKLSWDYAEDSIWFSVIVQNGNQVPFEIYNGSDTEFTTSDLESGLNRIRISAGSDDGKVSELSDSIFVDVEEHESSSSFLSESTGALILFALIAVTMVAVFIFERGE